MDDNPPGTRPYSTVHHRLPGFDYSDPDVAYFVTIRARSGIPFTDHRLADDVIASLHWLREHRGIALYAYCLMPDHPHLLLQLPPRGQGHPIAPSGRPRPAAIADPQHALSTIMSSFKSFTTNRSWKLGYRGALWQARFYDHIVRKSEGGQRIAEYIVHNPVRKGLVVEAGCINTAGPRTRCSERAWMAMGYVSAHERAGDGATSLLSLRFVAWQRRDVMETDGRLFLGPSASGVEQATKQPVNHFWRYTRARGHTRQAGSSLV